MYCFFLNFKKVLDKLISKTFIEHVLLIFKYFCRLTICLSLIFFIIALAKDIFRISFVNKVFIQSSIFFNNYFSCMSVMVSLVSLNNVVFSFINEKTTLFKYGLSIYVFMDTLIMKHFFIVFRSITIISIPMNLLWYLLDFKYCFFITYAFCILYSIAIMMSQCFITSKSCIDIAYKQSIKSKILSSTYHVASNPAILKSKCTLSSLKEYNSCSNNLFKEIKNIDSAEQMLNIFYLYNDEIYDLYDKIFTKELMKNIKENDLEHSFNFIIFFQYYDLTQHVIINRKNINTSSFNEMINCIIENLYKKYQRANDINKENYEFLLAAFISSLLISQHKDFYNIINNIYVENFDWYFYRTLILIFSEIYNLDCYYSIYVNKNNLVNISKIREIIEKKYKFFERFINFGCILGINNFINGEESLFLLYEDLKNYNKKNFIPLTKIMRLL